MSRTKLAIAKNYVRRGWPVLPVAGIKNGCCTCAKGKECKRPGKHPLTEHGVKDATTNLKLIRKWWNKHPDANIGIATGVGSGLVVVDIDPRNGGTETLKALEQELGKLPITLKAKTGGGGHHYFFAAPNKPMRSGKALGAGIDFLAEGSYAIMPGSAGLGRDYKWITGKTAHTIELAKLPRAWRQMLRRRDKVAQATKASDVPNDSTEDRSRNVTLTRMAGTMRRAGMTKDAIQAALLSQNASFVPPLEAAEVDRVASSVCKLYPEGTASGVDPALQLAHSVLANDFVGGRHLIYEQDRFWHFEKTHWTRVSEEWIKRKVLAQIKSFNVKAGANTASLLDQALRLLQVEMAAKENRLAGLCETKRVINTSSGELWIGKDGKVELRPHSPESYLTHCLDINYDPAATCPLYDKALLGIFSNAAYPKAMIRHWHELTGYILQPERNIPMIVVALGGGSNGKTKLVNTIIQLLGVHLVCAQPIGTFESNRFATASLFGKLLLLDDDVSSNIRLPDGFLKTISEGKIVTAEEKYRSPFNFRALSAPILLSNSTPHLADLSYGMQRRLMVIPFDKQFRGKEKDETLFDRIWASELPGILNRALDGLARLRERGSFKLPKDVRNANKKFLSDANPLPAFLVECCEKNIKSGIYLKEFYLRYQQWCEESGVTMKQQRNKVRKNLKNLGYTFGRGSGGGKVMGLRFT